MKKTLGLIFSLFHLTILFSQEDLSKRTTDLQFDINSKKTVTNKIWYTNSIISNDLEGSRYLFENWNNEAVIYDLDDKGYKLSNCNFNVVDNKLEALVDNTIDKVYVFNSTELSKIRINNKIFVNKKLNIDNSLLLLEVVQIGKNVSLFKLYNTSISLAPLNPMTQKRIGNDKIHVHSIYYIEKDNKLKEINLKKSSILNQMSDKKDLVKIFIKENKLSVAEDEDLCKIFNYYNTL